MKNYSNNSASYPNNKSQGNNNMFLENISSINQTTMSSREMAQLCSKSHDNVLKLVRSLISGGVVKNTIPNEYVHPQNNQTYIEYLSDKRDSLVIVARLSPEFTAAVVDRWQYLEAQVGAPVIPQTLPEALRLAADLAERVEQQQAQLAIAEPKAKALDVIDSSEGALNIRDTGKTLGVGQKKFIEWALKNEWLYRDSKNKLQAYSKRIQQGYLEIKATTYGHASFGSRATTQTVVTPQGLVQLSKVFSSTGKE